MQAEQSFPLRRVVAAALMTVVMGCGGSGEADEPDDGGMDGGADAGRDASRLDAASFDATDDRGRIEAGTDAGLDSGRSDTGAERDATMDVGTDAARFDAGADADADSSASCPDGQYLWDGACVLCDVRVPSDYADIGAAVAAAAPYQSVCVAAGSYTGDVTMRPHVHLVGAGPATVIDGQLDVTGLPDTDPTPTRITRLRIASGTTYQAIGTGTPTSPKVANSGLTYALTVQDVEFELSSSLSTWCTFFGIKGGDVRLVMRRLDCQSEDGARTTVDTNSELVDVRVVLEDSYFRPAASLFSPTLEGAAYVWLQQPTGVTPPAGSTVAVDVRNNVIEEGGEVAILRHLTNLSGDSYVLVANNTFVHGSTDNAIYDLTYENDQPSLTLANNVFYGYPEPIRLATFAATEVRNLSPTSDPFVELPASDYRPAAGTALVDFADPVYAPARDYAGVTRPVDGDGDGMAAPDVGAFERVP